MRRLRQLVNLNRADRRLFFEALTLLWIIRLGLWVSGYRRLRPAVERLKTCRSASRRPEAPAASSAPAAAAKEHAARVGWAVHAAGHGLPGDGTCLVRALAAEVLLGRRGVPAHVKFGVARDQKSKLRAHAWVEAGGAVVVGGGAGEQYKILTAFAGDAAAQQEESA